MAVRHIWFAIDILANFLRTKCQPIHRQPIARDTDLVTASIICLTGKELQCR